MKHVSAFLFVALVLIVTKAGAHIDPDVTCDAVQTTHHRVGYCYSDAAGRARGADPQVDVIYYFHGLGGSEQDLFSDRGRQILDLLKLAYGKKVPLIASISIGSGGVFAGTTDEIRNEGLQAIETKIAPGKTLRRILVGGSMGGHNTLRLAASTPKDFAAVAALCPALGTFDGYNSDEVDAYIKRHKGIYFDEAFFRRAIDVYKKSIPNSAEWIANNPFSFINQGAYDGLPIFLSVGREDQLGFVEGSREFKARADARPAMKVTYVEFRGPHCAFDPVALVKFLSAQF